MNPQSDRELLKFLELTEAFAASLLGKTRQAISSGLAEPVYFRDSDLATIVNYCRVNKPQQIGDIARYIEASRDPQRSREIISSHGMFLDSDSVLAAREVWAVLPDFRFFKSSHPAQAAVLCERARRDILTFTIVTSDPRDATLFWSDCPVGTPDARDASTQTVEAVDALPYSILLEPRALVQGWALVSGGFQKLDPMRTEGMRAFVGHKFDQKKVRMQSRRQTRTRSAA
jgi:hypothetical protein